MHKPDRQWRSSSFQESKKVCVSRDLWPWPWPWAHSGCTLSCLPRDHRVQVWWRSGHLPVRRSDFRASTKVPISRDLWPWPWPWPWAHPGCTLTWSPSCESLVAIRPFVCEKKQFAQKFTDRRTDGRRTPCHCISSFLEWANNNEFVNTLACSSALGPASLSFSRLPDFGYTRKDIGREYHVTFDLDLEHILDARWPAVHLVKAWWRSGHLSARRSNLRKSLQTDGRWTPCHCISSFLEWAKKPSDLWLPLTVVKLWMFLCEQPVIFAHSTKKHSESVYIRQVNF